MNSMAHLLLVSSPIFVMFCNGFCWSAHGFLAIVFGFPAAWPTRRHGPMQGVGLVQVMENHGSDISIAKMYQHVKLEFVNNML